MAKIFYPDFFNDIFGPIMQPGSSSSFAGVSRIARVARHTLISEPAGVEILFNPGEKRMRSLGNLMEDRGLLGGIQDFLPDDERLFSAHELARKAGISYSFGELHEDNEYPGSITFRLTGRAGEESELVGASIGGGMIRTYRINGFPIEWPGDTYALLVWNLKAEGKNRLQSFLEGSTAQEALAETKNVRNEKGQEALFLEFSEAETAEAAGRILEGHSEYRLLPAILPVVTTKDRKPQLFKNVEEWRGAAAERNISFVEAAIEYEKRFSGWDEKKIWDYFEQIFDILDRQIHSLETIGYENAKDTPNLPIYGRAYDRYLSDGKGLEDPITQRIIRSAMAVNAKVPGVKIVPGPMGTGGGYLFSAIDAVYKAKNIPHERVIESLIVAAGLGAVAYTNCQASGNSGCVGESGVCCAMGSGAVTYLGGGDGVQVEHAASMALQASLGIPCDPITGGKEFPCITRTIRAAVTAPLYADLALAGIDPLIPYHEVLFAIEENRKRSTRALLHDGINLAPCAQDCQKCFQAEQMKGKLRYTA